MPVALDKEGEGYPGKALWAAFLNLGASGVSDEGDGPVQKIRSKE